MIQENNNHLQVLSTIIKAKNVLTSCVPPKKYIKSYDLKYRMPNIDFCANNATKIIAIIHSVSFANRFTQIQGGQKMMINGSDVMNVIDGYANHNLEPYRM